MMTPIRIDRLWILCFQIAVCVIMGTVAAEALAADVTLAWNPNTESNLAGYRIHHGTANGSYSVHIDVQNVTRYTVTGLTAGQTYYFAATAYNASGNESGYSSPVSYTVPAVNGAPSTPATPSGPAGALVNTAVTFSTSATDPNGDSLQYRYDWGGGVLSNWGAASQSRSWAAAGHYAVKAQARDSLGAQSAWSAAKTVTITQSSPPVVVDSDGDGVPDSQDSFPNDPKKWADANGNGGGDNADAAATAQAPAAPFLVSPGNNAAVGAMPVLKTGVFRTAAPGTSHAKTRWQIFRDEDDVCVLDILSPSALTSFTAPKLVLDGKTPYFWRAQFIDHKGASSAWSDYEYFSTTTTGTDRNANGIPDAQEVTWKTDLDRDGIRDHRQKTIKSVKLYGTSAQVGVSIKGCPTALAIEAVESGSSYQASSSFPGVSFKIAVAKPGDRITVTIYFSDAAFSGNRWYVYDTVSGKWAEFSAQAKFAADRRSVTLTLTDGGPGDVDGVANGVIVHTGTIFVQ
jgi:chitinase